MEHLVSQQQNALMEIARKDLIYLTWQRSFEDCREAFVKFAADQPADIRNMLYGYADCGRMAQQRLVNLACEHMTFHDK